jgi:hypothetical protein
MSTRPTTRRRSAEAFALRRHAADSALRGAIEEIVLGTAPARDNAVRAPPFGDPEDVGALGDVVERRKGIETWRRVPARVRGSALAGI